ncbi:hypothetical protein LOTGIDRAFT_120936 [Lottia gigantea]|uniref:Spondin-like TSP1 domain-containing protein n=1 Tax=Lottia gigantea TaxID=225164 RepID=V3ZM25_LOTGI|nr:hypothetical protein LOTGIDRAFT_120936 [Lottia gigantea]ESO92403.1 hypothetical protein LOTGIDRAFT_120936 [Lottia gigantea]
MVATSGICSHAVKSQSLVVTWYFSIEVNGAWSLWGEWGDCSVTCEDGIRTRTRQCNHPPALHGGRPCKGEDQQTKPCTLSQCPIDGNWKPWQEWQQCNVTCGGGTQIRERECQLPKYGGATCMGSSVEPRECNTHNCPSMEMVFILKDFYILTILIHAW